MEQDILADQLCLQVEFNADRERVGSFEKLFEVLEGSFIPRPTVIDMPDTLKYPLSGFSDPMILQTLQDEVETSHRPFQLLHETSENIQAISPDAGMYSLTEYKLLPQDYATAARTLILELIEAVEPAFACCCFDKVSRRIFRKHFQWNERTHQSPNLVWLQYFSGHELERQGGEKILDNPYAQTEQTGGGILVEVGSPEGVYTAKGEDLIVEATNAMPPVE